MTLLRRTLLLAFVISLAVSPLALAEHPALRFARRDADRAAERAKLAAENAASVTKEGESAANAAQDATAAKSRLESHIKDTTDSLKQIETAVSAAEQSAKAAEALSKKLEGNLPANDELRQQAKRSAESAAQLLNSLRSTIAERKSILQQAQTLRTTFDKSAQAAALAAKPLLDAKAAADKAAAEVATQAKAAADRVVAFEKEPPKLNPTSIRLVNTFQHNSPFLSCSIDPSGEFVFAGAQDNSIQRWHIDSGEKASLAGHRSWISHLVFPNAGPLLVSTAYEGKLTWWDASSTEPHTARTVNAHKGFLRAIAVSPDGKLLATAGDDRIVRIWSTADGTLVKELAGHENHVYGLGFHPEGKHLVSGDLMGVVKQWEVGTWNHVRDIAAAPLHKYDETFRAHCGGVRAVAFSPDGKRLALGGIGEVTNAFAGIGKPTVLLFDWADGKLLQTFLPAGNINGSVWGLHFDTTGEILVGAGGGNGGGWIWTWKLDQPKALIDFKLPQAARDLALHPDGLRVAVALFDNTVRIYDLGPGGSAAPVGTKTAAAK